MFALFIIIFAFYKFKQKNKYSKMEQKDLYFFDKNTAKHPLILKKNLLNIPRFLQTLLM